MKNFKLLFLAVISGILFCSCGNTSEDKATSKTTESTLSSLEIITAGTSTTTTTTLQTTTEPVVTTTTVSETTTAETTTTTTATTTKATTTTTASTTTKTTTTAKPTTTTVITTAPPKHDPVEPTFFDDAIFIGDSVSLKLKLYCAKQMNNGNYPLGTATFFTAGSFSWTNSTWSTSRSDSVHPMINGKKMQIPEAVKATGAKKAFIMLGMNDIAPYGIDGTINTVETVTDEIKATSPDTVIYLQSVTPILAGKEKSKLNNENIQKFNTKLKELCDEKGYIYLDINTLMGGSSLKREYCGDPDTMGIHFTDAACKIWIEYLNGNV